ncbi:hypothetical protein DFJ74DRAFT_669214 [Hyaloraphidium curvatum]|nr:hypothetical protein DFJ74DRAFT_669214 [Hyaloraphidium curvatum]
MGCLLPRRRVRAPGRRKLLRSPRPIDGLPRCVRCGHAGAVQVLHGRRIRRRPHHALPDPQARLRRGQDPVDQGAGGNLRRQGELRQPFAAPHRSLHAQPGPPRHGRAVRVPWPCPRQRFSGTAFPRLHRQREARFLHRGRGQSLRAGPRAGSPQAQARQARRRHLFHTPAGARRDPRHRGRGCCRGGRLLCQQPCGLRRLHQPRPQARHRPDARRARPYQPCKD